MPFEATHVFSLAHTAAEHLAASIDPLVPILLAPVAPTFLKTQMRSNAVTWLLIETMSAAIQPVLLDRAGILSGISVFKPPLKQYVISMQQVRFKLAAQKLISQ